MWGKEKKEEGNDQGNRLKPSKKSYCDKKVTRKGGGPGVQKNGKGNSPTLTTKKKTRRQQTKPPKEERRKPPWCS